MAEYGRSEQHLTPLAEDSPSSLVPMLISGLALIVIGMIAVAVLV